MVTETWLVIGVLVLAGVAGTVWSARQYDRMVAGHQRQLDAANVVQDRSQSLLDRQEEVHWRSPALLDRHEGLLMRAELLMERLEMSKSSD